MFRLLLTQTILLVVFLNTPQAGYAISDEEVRLIREIEEVRYTIEHTEWTWSNRDQKKVYEDKLALLNQILGRVAQRKSQPTTQLPFGTRPPPPREVSSEEVRLLREIEEIKEELARTEWTWDNRNRKTALEKRLEFLENTLSRIGP
jgi:hypothetical protein